MLLQKLQNWKESKIMLNTFSRSLIIWEPAIETKAQDMNGGPGNELGTREPPHLGNYTLTSVHNPDIKVPADRMNSRNENCTLKSTPAYICIIDSSYCQCNSKSVITTIIAIITLLAHCLGNRCCNCASITPHICDLTTQLHNGTHQY